ncbi:MAG: NAD(P)/FAD-dependent oxidoreductase [Thermoanaerobaculia bacterium]
MRPNRHRVVIVGGGFAGLAAAKGLKRAPVEVTLVDRRNYHLFQPLLYQVATGGLSPADISAPIRAILHRQGNVTVVMERVVDIDVGDRRVSFESGDLPYDTLVIATGVRHHYFGRPEWEELAPGLKTVDDATEIRGRILKAFEDAERSRNQAEREALLTFVVVGGGATGVELVGAIAELARHTLKRDFRNIDSASARIILIEGADRVLPPYRRALSAAAEKSLARLGVEVRSQTLLEDVGDGYVTLRSKAGTSELAARTVLWAAGVKASSLAGRLAERTGAELDRCGRLIVEPDCTLSGHPELLAIGDICHFTGPDGEALPGVAPVAMQQGRFAARLIGRRLSGRPTPEFRYRDRGSLAVIGRAAAVADVGFLRFTGFFAWLLWLSIHIMYLVGFENRVLVLVQWAYSYFTHGRTARLITGGRRSRGAS